jgi:molybdenum cofactor cytidylyltransferase
MDKVIQRSFYYRNLPPPTPHFPRLKVPFSILQETARASSCNLELDLRHWVVMTRLSAAGALPFGVVILAAGRSARMGKPKLLLPWGRTSVLGHLIGEWQALGARQIAVVYAPGNLTIQAEMDRLGFPTRDRITNPAPERGMFSSIQCAARWPGWRAGLTHFAIVLGDQPHLQRQSLRQLLDFSAGHPARVCQPARRGHGRHPVLLPRSGFRRLAGSRARTLKGFLAANGRQVALCEQDDPGLDLDIDRPEDYEQVVRYARRQRSC